MKILRGWVAGTYICFYLCTVEAGRVKDVEGIAIEEDDFTDYVFPVIERYDPDFYIWDTANPIKRPACNKIAQEFERIVGCLKNGSFSSEVKYYENWLKRSSANYSIEELVVFLELLTAYLWEQEGLLGVYDYLNLEGF